MAQDPHPLVHTRAPCMHTLAHARTRLITHPHCLACCLPLETRSQRLPSPGAQGPGRLTRARPVAPPCGRGRVLHAEAPPSPPFQADLAGGQELGDQHPGAAEKGTGAPVPAGGVGELPSPGAPWSHPGRGRRVLPAPRQGERTRGPLASGTPHPGDPARSPGLCPAGNGALTSGPLTARASLLVVSTHAHARRSLGTRPTAGPGRCPFPPSTGYRTGCCWPRAWRCWGS